MVVSEQSRKLFLGGLDYRTTEDNLMSYFGQFGRLVDVAVMRFPDSKRSRGFGFITFSSPEETDHCLRSEPHWVDGKVLRIKKATPREDKESAGTKIEGFRKMFIGGLNYKTTDDGLKRYFEQFGEVIDCVVMKFEGTNKSRGFGFVTYSSVEAVDAVQANRPHTIDNRKVETKRATPRECTVEAGRSVKRLFIGGLTDAVDDRDIEEYFRTFGNVVLVEQMTDRTTGRRRRFGFVEFDDYDAVDKVMLIPYHQIKGLNIGTRKAFGKNEMNSLGLGNVGSGIQNTFAPLPWGCEEGFGFGNRVDSHNYGFATRSDPWQGYNSWSYHENSYSCYLTYGSSWGGGYGYGKAGVPFGSRPMRNPMRGRTWWQPYRDGSQGRSDVRAGGAAVRW